MAFKRMRGVEGLVYVPDEGGAKKHPCRDCHFCQWCSDDRCGMCRKTGPRNPGGCAKGKGRSCRKEP
ncbi:MAG TPA: hypothetical protein VGK67_19730 [Myxococcales bacterium]|jgi:hypothetical protein